MIEPSTIINSLISLTALAVAIYSLYLQRRDKKPRLTVEHKLGIRQIDLVPDDYAGHTLADDYCVLIILRNPTEKDITVSGIYFVEGGEVSTLRPWNGQLPTVGSHKAEEVIIARDEIVNKLKSTHIKGRFLVKDLLGNGSYSQKKVFDLDDMLSFFPTSNEYLAFVDKQNKRKADHEREN